MASQERRKAVRAPARLAMQIQLSGQDAARVETINVSANGVYFTTSSYIPTLTKLGVTLVLPGEGDSGVREVTVEGIVVRTEPEQADPATASYDVACYFTGISDTDREHLESYILKQLAF